MYLRSLTIRGFKSFAQKSVLRFEPGVTVIVGPNGSGKSNITDAVLWVLGEQSAKSLRGATMEDVIFAGSASKQALGTAEVALNLDNSDGRIPIEFSEVTISRRLYRSGESEYMINKTACRLIDIHEMLSDTGLGREMYSVISQGRLDDILNSKPHERRQLLEEAAGVLKHKRRKDRALRKLISMENNLSRGKDVLREVGRQLAPLKKQADQAVQYDRLNKELKDVQVAGAVGALRGLRERWELLAKEQTEKKILAEQLKQESDDAQTGMAALENELETKGFLAGDIGEYRRRLEGLSERINSGLLLLEEKGKNLIGKLSEFRQSIYQLESRIEQRRVEVESITTEKEVLEADLGRVYHDLAEARRDAEAVKKEGRSAMAALARAEEEAAARRNQVDKLSGDINRLSSAVESTSEKLAFLQEQSAAIDEKIVLLEAEEKTVGEEHAGLEAELPRMLGRLDEIKAKLAALAEAAVRKGSQIETAASELGEAQATIAALEAMAAKSLEDFSWLDGHKDALPETAGKVADLITVDKQHEKAIEAVLGLDAYAMVTKSLGDAVDVYHFACGQGDLPARLLANHDGNRKVAGPKGLRHALEVVKCPEFCRAAIEGLFANVWIIEEMSDWLSRGEPVPPGGVVVSLGGDFIDSRGLIVRQPAPREIISTLATKRQLAEAERARVGAAERLGTYKLEAVDIDEELESLRQAAMDASTDVQKVESRLMSAALRSRGHVKEIEALKRQREDIAERVKANETSGTADTATLVDLRAALDDAKEAAVEQAEAIKSEREAAGVKIEAEKETAERLSGAQVAVASLTERQTHLKSRQITAQADLDQARERLTAQKKMVAGTEELRLRIQPVHDLYTQLRLEAEAWSARLEKSAGAEQAEAAAMREDLRRRRQILRDLSVDLNNTNEALTAAEVAKAQVEVEVGQITKHLVDELGVSLETALAGDDKIVDAREWREKEERVRAELSRLGPINQIAAAEYTKLEERHQFLGRQIDDLVRSRKALEKLVGAIDKKITAKFKITFDEVNSNFNRVFNELFPGGTARLVLTEDDDGGEPGIEIEAQPHGKRLQSLSLLSGGERSLVGLGLLFALYYTRPSPFYILDEVEAALDDANLLRFIRLLDRLKVETQFLIITHQRRTMEIADCIYGVAMQADGMSKVISQKLSAQDESHERREAELVATAVGQPEQVQGQS